MSKSIRNFLITIAPLALLGLGAQVHAQATDVNCSGCVDANDIAFQAVTKNKIAAEAVTKGKIAPSAVTRSKIKRNAVTTGKIRDGAVTVDKVAPELKAGIGTFCPPGEAVVGMDVSGNWVCEPVVAPSIPADCNELLFSGQLWGVFVTGFDLRARTNSTLHFVGCPGDGCNPATFYCNFDAATETLAFGTTSNILRALVDPGDALGDTNPTSSSGCCDAADPNSLCNAPDSNANGSSINPVVALCDALGYRHGSIVRQNTNGCPEAHATGLTGLSWDSDWVFSNGGGDEYLCGGFR